MFQYNYYSVIILESITEHFIMKPLWVLSLNVKEDEMQKTETLSKYSYFSNVTLHFLIHLQR